MAGLWTEGFETHQTGTQWDRRYATRSGSFGITSGRVFGSAGTMQAAVFVIPSFALETTVGVAFGLNLLSQTGAFTALDGFYFERGGVEQVHLEFVKNVGSFEVKVMRGATQLGITTSTFAYSAWHHFELKVVPNTATGSFELRHNEVNVLSASGINTAGSGSNQADGFAMRFASTSTNNIFDDIGVWGGSGAAPTDFVGDCVVEGIQVTGAGASTQWTPSAGSNFDNVDDSGGSAPDDAGAGGFNSSDTVGQVDLYAFGDLTQIDGTILWVQLDTQLAMAATGSRNVLTKYRDPDTTVVDIGATKAISNTVYASFADVMSVNPNTAAAWDVTEIDGGQFGVEIDT